MEFLYEKRAMTLENLEEERNAINVYPSIEKQTLMGFGGAFTEAAAYNYSMLDAESKKAFLDAYYDKTAGAGYVLGRVHMGSCDFALELYSETSRADLSDFNIEQDKKYVIPMIKDALAYLGDDLFLFAAPWSPPAFMKDSDSLIGGGKLKKEFYATYAEYFAKFVKAYAAEGIKISAVTVQNEPHALQTWESCLYTAEEEAEFAAEHLRPTLDRHGLTDVKIIAWDHNRDRLLERAITMFSNPRAREAIWGVGFHWYVGTHFEAIAQFREMFPEKEIFETELCHESSESFDDENRTFDYANEYISCLSHGAAGVCDWNLMLDSEMGGPYHNRTTGGCAAPTYCDPKTGKMILDGIYAPIKLISSVATRGDVVVFSTASEESLNTVAVKKADGSIVLLVLNSAEVEKSVLVRMGGKTASFTLPARSLSANALV